MMYRALGMYLLSDYVDISPNKLRTMKKGAEGFRGLLIASTTIPDGFPCLGHGCQETSLHYFVTRGVCNNHFLLDVSYFETRQF